MCNLVLLAALIQAAPEPAAPSGLPPEQGLASIDAKGNLTITFITCSPVINPWGGYSAPMQEEKGTGKGPAKVKVTVTPLLLTKAELSAKDVEAHTADGRPISAEKLRTLLARERTVLIVTDGKKLDSFHLQLYKEDTIVLVPPANTLNRGGAGTFNGGAYGGYGAPLPVREPKVPIRPPDDTRPPK